MYLWSFGDSSVAAGGVVSHHYKKVDSHVVCLMVVDTCYGCDTTICGTVIVPCFSTEVNSIRTVSGSENNFKVFPNPASGQFAISTLGQNHHRILDAFGRTVLSGSFTDAEP